MRVSDFDWFYPQSKVAARERKIEGREGAFRGKEQPSHNGNGAGWSLELDQSETFS